MTVGLPETAVNAEGRNQRERFARCGNVTYDARMSATIHVHMLPELVRREDLAEGVVVVIDVLRATTTMLAALVAGAKEVIPCRTTDETRAAAGKLPPGSYLLGGERQGVLIPGFDLDNSPRGYTPERVAGKTLIFTTTNGTRALHHAALADTVLIGAFVNRAAVIARLRQAQQPLHLLCAGTDGHLTAEDILFAGSVAGELLRDGHRVTLDVSTEMAVRFAERRTSSSESILETLRESRGGTNLIELGYDADIVFAATPDRTSLVPAWDARSNRIANPGERPA